VTLALDIAYLAVVGALTLRLAIVTATLPLLDRASVPLLWRLAVAAALAAALAPAVVAASPVPVTVTWPLLVTEALRSLLVGALVAFTVNLAFTAVRYAGHVVGMQIGFAIVNSFDPQSGAQVSVVAQLYYLLAVLFFFAVDGHHALIEAMYQSCVVLPPLRPIDAGAGAWLMLQEYGSVFSLGLRIAAPVVIVLLLISATMGVIVKTVPQINVLVVGFPIKIAAGLLTLGLSLVIFREVCLTAIGGLQGQLGRVLLALH
jgi:flagellar biosynthetic protein FliR